MAVGSCFAGEEGKSYIKILHEIAWEHEPQTAELLDYSLDMADAKRGQPSNAPERMVIRGG